MSGTSGTLMPEIILYDDWYYGGIHIHFWTSVPDFTQVATGVGGSNWNDRVSSFVIVWGYWQFFKDVGFLTPYGFQGPQTTLPNGAPMPNSTLGPGLYGFVDNVGIDNHSLSSIQLVFPQVSPSC